MRTPPQPPPPATSLLFLYLLVLSAVCHHVAALDANDTYSEKNDMFSGDHSTDEFQPSSVTEAFSESEVSSGTEYDYYEEYEENLQLSGYIIDDSIKVEHLVKPKKNETESEKKPKTRRKKNKDRKRKPKKMVNPCDEKYKTYCIHGECKYIESLETATCKLRKAHSNAHDQEAEERKHLKQENGNGPISV